MYLFRDVFIYKTTAAGTAVIIVTGLIGNKPQVPWKQEQAIEDGWGEQGS